MFAVPDSTPQPPSFDRLDELDCVHEVPKLGAWLKVPLGKLDTERMVPLDDDARYLIDRLAARRSPGRPLPRSAHR